MNVIDNTNAPPRIRASKLKVETFTVAFGEESVSMSTAWHA